MLPGGSYTILSADKRLEYVTSKFAELGNGSMTFPTGIEEGDVIFAFAAASEQSTTAVYGTGFTSLGTQQESYTVGKSTYRFRQCLSYKIADGTESSSTIGGFLPNSINSRLGIAVYRPKNFSASSVSKSLTFDTDFEGPKTISAGIGRPTVPFVFTTSYTIWFGNIYANTTYTPTQDVLMLDTGNDRRSDLYVGPPSKNISITETYSGTPNITSYGYFIVN